MFERCGQYFYIAHSAVKLAGLFLCPRYLYSSLIAELLETPQQLPAMMLHHTPSCFYAEFRFLLRAFRLAIIANCSSSSATRELITVSCSINSPPLTSCANPCCAATGDRVDEVLTNFDWDPNSCVSLGVLDSHCVVGARSSETSRNVSLKAGRKSSLST